MGREQLTGLGKLLPAVLCVALLSGGCDSSFKIDIGAIRVEVTAIGNNLDSDGYTITVTGNGENQSQPVDVNGEVVFAVPAGQYTVELTDLADNCVVDLNPQLVRVRSGETSRLLFNTLCG